MVVQSLSSFILKAFDTFIRDHRVVVFYLTMLVGAGGNAGSQSAILVVRGLATGGVRLGDAGRVLAQQVLAGLVLGGSLMFFSFFRVLIFHNSVRECIAIACSMFLIVFTSVVVGTLLPLLLKRLRIDPAHAGAAIQVAMDIMGVALTCGVCWAVLHRFAPPHADGIADVIQIKAMPGRQAVGGGIIKAPPLPPPAAAAVVVGLPAATLSYSYRRSDDGNRQPYPYAIYDAAPTPAAAASSADPARTQGMRPVQAQLARLRRRQYASAARGDAPAGRRAKAAAVGAAGVGSGFVGGGVNGALGSAFVGGGVKGVLDTGEQLGSRDTLPPQFENEEAARRRRETQRYTRPVAAVDIG
eukprot:GHVU01147978.1.p1 GENE.GHVU01147978.1~~GHVU01147978.1.p1  ORF type:complete len:356 (-),score=60.57 GHVU01147978.1:229-1296(-)